MFKLNWLVLLGLVSFDLRIDVSMAGTLRFLLANFPCFGRTYCLLSRGRNVSQQARCYCLLVVNRLTLTP
jgi:hypothetical protein